MDAVDTAPLSALVLGALMALSWLVAGLGWWIHRRKKAAGWAAAELGFDELIFSALPPG